MDVIEEVATKEEESWREKAQALRISISTKKRSTTSNKELEGIIVSTALDVRIHCLLKSATSRKAWSVCLDILARAASEGFGEPVWIHQNVGPDIYRASSEAVRRAYFFRNRHQVPEDQLNSDEYLKYLRLFENSCSTPLHEAMAAAREIPGGTLYVLDSIVRIVNAFFCISGEKAVAFYREPESKHFAS